MLGVFTAPDAVVIAAALAAAGTAGATWWNSHQAVKQTKPNGGSSMRDVVDRIEAKIDNHTGRIAVLEAALDIQPRHPRSRTRKDDR